MGARGVKPTPEWDRFWPKVDASGDCWEWIAARDPNGYGRFRKALAHRWAYIHLVGPIPDALPLDHLCRNPPCVNPDHLEPVTHGVNYRRGYSPSRLATSALACKRGHLWDSVNSIVRTNGRRYCRACYQMLRGRAVGQPRWASATSRYRGVSWDKVNRKWRAQISVGGKNYRAGRFINEEDAAEAVRVARLRMGI